MKPKYSFFFQLLTVYPVENSLSLVYRDVNTLRFVKHINHTVVKAGNKNFFDVATVYYEWILITQEFLEYSDWMPNGQWFSDSGHQIITKLQWV